MIFSKHLIITIALAVLNGCGVSSFKAQNWNANNPADLSSELYRSKSLDSCRQQATLTAVKSESGNAANSDLKNSNVYANVDKPMLNACMASKGYTLRELTNTETTMNYLAAPVVVPLWVFGKKFDDVY